MSSNATGNMRSISQLNASVPEQNKGTVETLAQSSHAVSDTQDEFKVMGSALTTKKLVIIHPGSKHLRIGRASDVNPHTILHAIARPRRKNGPLHRDPVLIPTVVLSKENKVLVDETYQSMRGTLQSCLRSDGTPRPATSVQQVATSNKQCTPIQGSISKLQLVTKSEVEDYIIGDQVLYVHPMDQFNVHFPFRHGDLNIHSGVGGSLSSVLADLETIWGHCIVNLLEIPKSELKHYRAVLVIPDIYNRLFLKELVSLLLTHLGFGGCFLLQDHVAATFGAGLGAACVVDLGDQKTSVSCVEDALSQRATRIRLDYGGSDITQSFHYLLQRAGFPYKECQPQHPLDGALLTRIKEGYCHLNLDFCGLRDVNFVVERPGVSTLRYHVKVGDELLLAPLGLFNTEVFALTGQDKRGQGQANASGDPEDPHDANYLRETSRRAHKEALENQSASAASMDTAENSTNTGGQGEEDLVVDSLAADAAPDDQPQQQLLYSLDQAILHSIERCSSDEMKRRMYSCILLVGGGAKFEGLSTWLHNRLLLQIPFQFRPEQTEIIVGPKEMDPSMVAWKGAAIMSCLESAQELWIRPAEWKKIGVRLLRERAPFYW
uniref:Actin-related protein 8 n=2 Tax=Daphnia pulex TaxID=6669 RepID=A0A4Y7MVT0_DAPPU|nr:EOG090X02LT [Daphnia pulex]